MHKVLFMQYIYIYESPVIAAIPSQRGIVFIKHPFWNSQMNNNSK